MIPFGTIPRKPALRGGRLPVIGLNVHLNEPVSECEV
jgi:hypothetical protein